MLLHGEKGKVTKASAAGMEEDNGGGGRDGNGGVTRIDSVELISDKNELNVK
ncbi:hypothetical protein A2U01_0064550 [Trifolium medium]|uniref:Uncharacterized protein n=1 Tax=Trifolium medium TaxID=97028 RepID=A0A392S327_9FABA|nr:hypothetical protein [Trifolium medium]